MRRVTVLIALGAVLGLGACDAITSIAVQGAAFGGATADAFCDRRFVDDGGSPSAFCQDIENTVAASQFADDCRTKHQATSGPGLCPRAHLIAGCLLEQQNQDGSQVWDWYYDVVDGPDAGDAGVPPYEDAAAVYEPPIAYDVSDVAAICADRTRYPNGAELVLP